MAKVEFPFHVPGKPEFRFALTLESRSVEAHSLIDSGKNREALIQHLQWLIAGRDGAELEEAIEAQIFVWKKEKR